MQEFEYVFALIEATIIWSGFVAIFQGQKAKTVALESIFL